MSIEAGPDEVELPRYLWTPPDQRVDPPTETKQFLLPVNQLSWPNVERLFLRLLTRTLRTSTANLFGIAGQSQDGIDVYARTHSALAQNDTKSGRPYVVLQSKRVRDLAPGDVRVAVDKFMAGAWASRSEAFYYATSHSLQPTKLDEEIRAAEDRLGEHGIAFVPWGIDRISELLHSEPDIIDDFFGREWVRVVCGTDVANSLGARLTHQDFGDLRTELGSLYRSVFRTQDTGVANYGFNSAGSATTDFIILDGVELTARSPSIDLGAPATDSDEAPAPASEIPINRRRRRRPATRGRRYAASDIDVVDNEFGRQRLDTWMASGRLNLLVGQPGSGKSSFLRFLASDILSSDPQSTVIARELGHRLPIWLPFAFLCTHLGGGQDRSVLSAVRAWLNRHDSSKLWPLVESAMNDDRLLLIVDGLDEWSNPQLAETALGQLEVFLDHHEQVVAVSSTRPYSLNVLALTLNWHRAQIAALTAEQQREIVNQVLTRTLATPDEADSTQASGEAQSQVQTEALLRELTSVQHLADLARSPLFLVLLASVWQGQPLPTRRFDMYNSLVTLLIVQHPQMRRRSSQLTVSELTSDDTQRLWAAVAYRLRADNATGYTTQSEMRRHIVDALMDEAVLYWTEPRARDAADDIMTTAEQHLGLLVSHGSGTIGFLHRVFYEHLAGEHLSRLPLADQESVSSQRAADPAWRDVILSMLSAQQRPNDAKRILDHALANNAGATSAPYQARELLAEAIACSVRLLPKDLAAFIDELVTTVEVAPQQTHRLNLLTSLTACLASRPAKEHLMPHFRRWMRARTAEPGSALTALGCLTRLDDDTVWRHLVWGLRHGDEATQIQAAEAVARRFASNKSRLLSLLQLVDNTDTPSTAAAVVLATSQGWPDEPETAELITWARNQQSLPLRIAGLSAYRRAVPTSTDFHQTDDEKRWLISVFKHDGYHGPWKRLALSLLSEAVGANPTIANECLQTLADNRTDSWDRDAAWALACDAFADDPRFRHWVTTQLETEKHPLVLYPMSSIPPQWGRDESFRQAVVAYITRVGPNTINEEQIYHLSALAVSPDTRDALIGCLDTWRPSPIMRALQRDYPDDPELQQALTDRFNLAPAQASKYSFLAIEFLGLTKGFEFLHRILSHNNYPGSREAAVALAIAWTDCQTMVKTDPESGTYTAEAVREARGILSGYDPEALPPMCLNATSGTWAQNWSDHILRAWPTHPAVVARAKSLLDAIDARPAEVLTAYGERHDSESCALTTQALSQLHYLDPAMREKIGIELGAHNHDPQLLVDLLLDEWVLDYDRTTSRVLAVTLAHGLERASTPADTADLTPALSAATETFHKQVSSEMIALGSDSEERRQTGWLAMLITRNYTLLNSACESHNPQQPARVSLGDWPGDTNVALTGLVARSWEDLEKHCSASLFDWFGSFFDQDGDGAHREREVWSQFATIAHSDPAVAARLNAAIAIDPELRADRRVVRWLATQKPGRESLVAVLSGLDRNSNNSRAPELDLIESTNWELSQDEIRTEILRAAAGAWQRGGGNPTSTSVIDLDTQEQLVRGYLELFTELYPRDPITQARLSDLSCDLQRKRPNPWTWPELIALAVNVPAANHLPIVLLRVYCVMTAQDAELFHALFVQSVSRRLRADQKALAAVVDSAQFGATIQSSTGGFLAGSEQWVQYDGDSRSYWHSFFFARLLDGCGLFSDSARAAFRATLPPHAPHIVVHDPIDFCERLLDIALTGLFA